MASSQVTVATANSKMNTINGDMTSIWWRQRPLNEVNARNCRDRLNEIIMGGVTASIDGGAGDVFALL